MLFCQETSGATRSAIRELGFEVFSYGLFTKRTVKETLGVINQPVVRLPSSPGDIVSADDDGVMVAPKATSAAVVKIAARIETPLSRA